MWRVQQPRKRIYTGPIDLDAQPTTWIGKHRSFADRTWVESQVRYGKWIRDIDNEPDCFLVYATILEGRKSVKVIIKFKNLATHVLVYHAHVL
jgi:hypothetical protein